MHSLKQHARSLFLAALALLTVADARAERWHPPEPRDFVSVDGAYEFRLTPIDPARAGEGEEFGDDYWQGELLRSTEGGEAESVWKAPIGWPPVGVIVANGGQVVLVDIWGRAGWERSLAVYSPEGDELANLALEDILTAEEIERHVFRLQSSRNWTSSVAIALEEPLEGEKGESRLGLHCAWGPVIHVSLEDGSVRREGADSPAAEGAENSDASDAGDDDSGEESAE